MQERLQKIIAAAGLASRRHAEEMITGGLVSVNGKIVTVLGTKADPSQDHIKVQGKLINPLLAQASKIYVLLNKPRGLPYIVVRPGEQTTGHGSVAKKPAARASRRTAGISIPKDCCC